MSTISSPPAGSNPVAITPRTQHPLPSAPLPSAPPAIPPDWLDRRRVLSRAVLAAFAGLAPAASSARAAPSPPSVSADVDPSSLIRKLVGRITFGATIAERALADSLGYQGYLERQLNLTDADEDPAVTSAITSSAPPSTGLFPWINSGGTALRNQSNNISWFPVSASLIDCTIFRQIFSRRQLFERMVEFWNDHFSTWINSDQLITHWTKLLSDRDVIRPNAMRSFEELLNATARSAAMLFYLNNDLSTVGAINENYAREILELHTLGVTGGYTQQDIVAVARCLTGWNWYERNPPAGLQCGAFRYIASDHDNNAKTLSPLFNLANPGQPLVIPAGGGQNDGQTILNILAAHPTTARFIASKLCRHFIGEDCPASVIDAVKAAYLSTTPKGDVKMMLRVMLDPNVLADATPRLKRPSHLFASAMRAVLPAPTGILAFSELKNYYETAGHLHFAWISPDGYPDSNRYWTGLLLPRWNFSAALVTNSAGTLGGINGITIDAPALAAFFPNQSTRDQVVTRLNQVLFAGAWTQSEQNIVRNFLPATTLTPTQKRDAIGLALSSPSFQYI